MVPYCLINSGKYGGVIGYVKQLLKSSMEYICISKTLPKYRFYDPADTYLMNNKNTNELIIFTFVDDKRKESAPQSVDPFIRFFGPSSS